MSHFKFSKRCQTMSWTKGARVLALIFIICFLLMGFKMVAPKYLFKEFKSGTPAEKLNLLPQIERHYKDSELPSSVAYFLTLKLLSVCLISRVLRLG